MQDIWHQLKQGLWRKLLLLTLVSFLGFLGISISGYAPAYATTLEEIKLIPPEYQPTPAEKIERAYEYSEATGMMEEAKQAKSNASQKFNPNLKANIKNIDAQAEADKTSLKDKAKGLLERVTP